MSEWMFFVTTKCLFHFTVYEAAENPFSADGQHVELSPDDFTVRICFQLALNVVPDLLLRVELSNVGLRVVETFDNKSVTDAGSSWDFDRLKFAIAKNIGNYAKALS